MSKLLTSLRENKEIRQPKAKDPKAKELVNALRDEIVPAFQAGFFAKTIYKQLVADKRFPLTYSSFNRAVNALHLNPKEK